MFKKFSSLIFLIGAISILSCGCVYNQTSVTVNPDGSGKVVQEVGFSKQILNKLGETPKDYFGKNNEYHLISYNGKEYLGTTFEDAFRGSIDINTAGVGSISSEMGPVDLIYLDNGLRLSIKLNDDFSSNMTAKHVMPSFENISRETLQGMGLKDVIAQNVDGIVLKAAFNMPYTVTQINGVNDGVTVNGKTITLDYLKMIKSDCHEWIFDSIKSNSVEKIYNDVNLNSWYFKAVNTISNRNLMNGYNGNFYPNNQLTLAELCKIAANVSGEDIENDSEYWAKNYIEFAQYNNLVPNMPITKENWNVPATREQAVYAITIAANTMNRIKITNSLEIKDFNSISQSMQETILLAYDLGFVNGSNDGSFNPKNNITRAEICQILYNIQ